MIYENLQSKVWGTGGREFKSPRSDQLNQRLMRQAGASSLRLVSKKMTPSGAAEWCDMGATALWPACLPVEEPPPEAKR